MEAGREGGARPLRPEALPATAGRCPRPPGAGGLDEPTDDLDLESAEALQQGLEAYEGTVLAVTHDRWFARTFDRFLVFGADGRVREAPEPMGAPPMPGGPWGRDEGRVARAC